MGLSIWILIILLIGCTQPETMLLVKDGISREQVESDQIECDQAPTVEGYTRRSDEEFLRCMKTKGYRETTSKESNESKSSIPTWSGLPRPLSR